MKTDKERLMDEVWETIIDRCIAYLEEEEREEGALKETGDEERPPEERGDHEDANEDKGARRAH